MGRQDIGVHTIDYPFPHEFYQLHLMIETKIITISGTQYNDIEK